MRVVHMEYEGEVRVLIQAIHGGILYAYLVPKGESPSQVTMWDVMEKGSRVD